MDDVQQEYGFVNYDRIDMDFPRANMHRVIPHLAKNFPASVGKHNVDHASKADGIKFFFTDKSWILVRTSMTEPVVRIYVESTSRGDVQKLLSTTAQIIQKIS